MSDNTGKWKTYADAAVLSASGGVQNLNVDLEKNLADESDLITDDILGGDFVVSGLAVSTTTGLAVEIAAGTVFLNGQRIRQTVVAIVGALTPNATLKIYVQAGTPFSTANKGWPATFGATAGSLTSDQMLLALVTTDGSGVTLITDMRALLVQLKDVPSKALANSFAAQQTIAPTSPVPPLVLGANAQGQKVVGLNADQLDNRDEAYFTNAGNINTGTLPDLRLSGNVPLRTLANVFTKPQTFNPDTITAAIIIGGNGYAQLIAGLNAEMLGGESADNYHNASLLNAGTLPNERLSIHVPLKGAPGIFTGKPNFSAGAEVGSGNDVWHKGNDPKHGARVHHSVNQSIPNDGQFYTLIFNTDLYETTGSIHTGSSSALIIPSAGTYQISFNIAFAAGAGTFRAARILFNGNTEIAPMVRVAPVSSGQTILNASMPMGGFLAGQTLELQVAHNAATAIDILSTGWTSPSFAIQFLR